MATSARDSVGMKEDGQSRERVGQVRVLSAVLDFQFSGCCIEHRHYETTVPSKESP